MPRILIIGYGNPLRCDDGVGWRAAEELSQRLSAKDVEIITRHQLTPELAAEVSRAEKVFFLDAARAGTPGEVKCAPVVAETPSASLSHECSPSAVLDISRTLYGRVPQAFAISVCGEDFGHGEGLSGKVAASLPSLVKWVVDLSRLAQ